MSKQVQKEKTTETVSESSSRSYREKAKSILSLRKLIVTTIIAGIGMGIVGTFLPLPGASLLGMFGAVLALGLFGYGEYVESGIAGAVLGGLALSTNTMAIASVGDFGAPALAVAPVVGLVVALIGSYIGQDTYKGFTEDI